MSKSSLRKKARDKRKEMSSERRVAAGKRLVEILSPRLEGPTLSFASFGDEIDLWPLNRILAAQNHLFLPGADHTRLTIFPVADFETLEKSKQGFLAPRASTSPAPLETIRFVLVPALAFDSKGGRIGYGGGFYDRLLAALGKNTHKIGVGFVEQLSCDELPHEDHDIYVDELVLV